MSATKLQEQVSQLGAYKPWEDLSGRIDEAHRAMPAKNEDDPNWLRSRADIIESHRDFVGATALLQMEIASTPQIKLPYRIGAIRGLQRYAAWKKTGPVQRSRAGFSTHFGGETVDLKMSDFKHGHTDPFVFGEQIGDAVSDIDKILKRNKHLGRTTPAAILTVGMGQRPHTLYTQPTDAAYYRAISPESGTICEEPIIVRHEDGPISIGFSMPKLTVVRAEFDRKTRRIVPKPKDAEAETIKIPDIQMLDSRTGYIEASKLLLGRAATTFANKHDIDMQQYREKMRRRAENWDKLSEMRFR